MIRIVIVIFFILQIIDCLHLKQQQQYITNPKSYGILGRNLNDPIEYFQMQANILNKDQTVKICPLNTSFAKKNQCIKCQTPNNLFDIQTLECTICPQNMQYNATYYICQSQIKQLKNKTQLQLQSCKLQ